VALGNTGLARDICEGGTAGSDGRHGYGWLFRGAWAGMIESETSFSDLGGSRRR